MSWDLEIAIELDEFSDAARLITAMVRLSQPFLGRLRCQEKGSGWTHLTPVFQAHQLDPRDDHASFFAQTVARLRNADSYLKVELLFEIEDVDLHLTPVYIYIFGSAHTGLSEYGRRFPVVIDFCNRQRWKGNDNLITGEPADEQFLVRWLTAICDRVRPRSLYVPPEENVYVPCNYHLVYHNTPAGHADDLRDLASLALKGGRRSGYRDARRRYKPLLDIPGENILFCRRAGGRLDDLKNELRERRPILEKLLDGLEVPDEFVETAALSSTRIEPMDTKTGLGIIAEPFLRYYSENFYLHMLHLLATQ
ncbi:MAG: hypothetical protein MJE77_45740 [Proteobacteria bacterium]|nr:hypothetical protein [Pseudomonadota bacterium]